MDNPADRLMTHGVVSRCDDCSDQRLFVPIGDEPDDLAEYCCTICGAAVLIDPLLMPIEISALVIPLAS